MENSLETLKFHILNNIKNDLKVLYVNDNVNESIKSSADSKLDLTFLSNNIEARCSFRKIFNNCNGFNVIDKFANGEYNAVVSSREMLSKYFDNLSLSEMFSTAIISFNNVAGADNLLINKLKNDYKNVYVYSVSKVNECFVASLTKQSDFNTLDIIIVASNNKLNLDKIYATTEFKKNVTQKIIKNFDESDKESFWINYLNSEIKRTQRNLYLLFGPLVVAKRVVFKCLRAFPPARLAYKVLKAYKEGGIKLVKERIQSVTGLKKLNNQHDYSSLFTNNKEYVSFDSEYQENIDFSGNKTDVKMLAYYLPQFHTFKENDEWWGKGFTEWTNTRASMPLFDGHYQPRTPHKDIGYYDLSNIETLKKQAELAKQHGIYGFCFYYYWFSGKRLMEKPVDLLIEHKEIDIPFCLCWANENWTRAWDGQTKSILIKQDYSEKDDETFIVDMKKYIDDSRYIRINGKPLVVVYNPGQIPNCEKSFNTWRKVAREIGIGEILIWTCRTSNNTAKRLNIEDLIDAEVEFPPHNTWLDDFAVRDIELNGKSASIFNYQKLVEAIKYDFKNGFDVEENAKPIHHSCMMAWDNAARRKNNWFTYHSFSLKSLYDWVKIICEQARRDFSEEERFVFVNAWNEWAEGTYLEPDEKFGYANINTISKALFNKSFKDDCLILNNSDKAKKSYEFNKKIAIQIHMFYLETLDETIENLNKIPFNFDCYISTDTEEKAEYIKSEFSSRCNCKKLTVEVFENRGRDVAPFIAQMSSCIDEYDYIGHIHSKKTVKADHGNDWREYIFHNMFGSEDYVRTLFKSMEDDSKLGIVFPVTFSPLEYQAEWGGNLKLVEGLLSLLDVNTQLPQSPVFPVGNMFWAKTEAVRQMFKIGLGFDDFPKEAGQVNQTIAHAIERSWVYLAKEYGYHHKTVFNNIYDITELDDKKRIAFYVHYNKDNLLSESDVESLKEYKKIFDDIVFVSNSNLEKSDLDKLSKITEKVYLRENTGYDFGGWKFGLEKFGYENLKKYNQVSLINNSTLPPVFDLKSIFNKMESKKLDFWGITLFPELKNGKYLSSKGINEHLQSYFIVFENNIISSGAIKKFFDNLKETNTFKNAVKNGEVKLTSFMKKMGFTYAPYINESYYICSYLNNFSIPYEKPTSLVLLGSPFVKKKAFDYMDVFEEQKLKELFEKIN